MLYGGDSGHFSKGSQLRGPQETPPDTNIRVKRALRDSWYTELCALTDDDLMGEVFWVELGAPWKGMEQSKTPGARLVFNERVTSEKRSTEH